MHLCLARNLLTFLPDLDGLYTLGSAPTLWNPPLDILEKKISCQSLPLRVTEQVMFFAKFDFN
jgi:hypothetical protein